LTLENTDGGIGGLPIGAACSQAEVQALRDKCERLADDVWAASGLLQSLRTPLVGARVIKGGRRSGRRRSRRTDPTGSCIPDHPQNEEGTPRGGASLLRWTVAGAEAAAWPLPFIGLTSRAGFLTTQLVHMESGQLLHGACGIGLGWWFFEPADARFAPSVRHSTTGWP